MQCILVWHLINHVKLQVYTQPLQLVTYTATREDNLSQCLALYLRVHPLVVYAQ